MDPDFTLSSIREMIEAGEYEAAAGAFVHLDTWLTAGGTRPADWGIAARRANGGKA